MRKLTWIALGTTVTAGLCVVAAQAGSRLSVATAAAEPALTRLDPITLATVPADVTAPVSTASPELAVAGVSMASIRPAPIDPRSPARPAVIVVLPR